MRKFTTIILLSFVFYLLNANLYAQNADIDLLRSLNSNSSVGLRSYSTFISNTTSYVSISVPIVMGVASMIEKDETLFKNSMNIAVAIAIDAAFTYSLKNAFNRPRPYETYPDLDFTHAVSSASFPSGHTSLAFSTATALSLNYPKWYVIAPSYLWACSVGYSRMNIGVHYPSDVLAGAILGAGSAYLSYKINDWLYKKVNPKKLLGLNNYFL